MSPHRVDQSHDHETWHLGGVRSENCESGRLHRHRVQDAGPATRYTTWAHDTPQHTHRLPDGAWTGRRRSLVHPRPLGAMTR